MCVERDNFLDPIEGNAQPLRDGSEILIAEIALLLLCLVELTDEFHRSCIPPIRGWFEGRHILKSLTCYSTD